MQWAYEAKKLESTVKHLSWVPPWVCVADSEDANKFCKLFVGTVEDKASVIDDEVGQASIVVVDGIRRAALEHAEHAGCV